MAANPDVPAGKVIALADMMGASIAGYRSTIWIFLSFAGAALLLATIGLYGLMSYSVCQRTYEISVRMAIGAQASSVVRLILGQSLRITVLGMVAGIAVSLAVTNLLSGMLFGTTATDPSTFGAVSALVLLVTIMASLIPAWRAARIDPIKTLRAE